MDIWDRMMRDTFTDWERDIITDKYLSEYDPYYSSKKKNKIDSIEYPYHTVTQKSRIERFEIPESSLNVAGTLEVKRKGGAENKEL